MEITNIEQGGRRKICREMSPDRAKMCMMRPTFKKVQVVYYLSRNGHLEHPHYMEVSSCHQQLRLKGDKNGYVWNDLSENDVIFPSEGAEYVLKGSELVLGCTEKLVQLQFGNVQNQQQAAQDPNFHPKRKSLASKRRPQHQETFDNQYNAAEEEHEQEHKAIYGSCSKGVSTEEIFGQKSTQKNNVNVNPTELTLETHSFSSHKSTTSTSTTLSDADVDNRNSRRFADGGDDPVGTSRS
ncbi:UNVERIFIED_CONTAM: protein UPSTREAM OF FLC [Sesamum angustifolium]|uniref:Protein UPSTREAM OF FLC n=1 Tax=Sesamum angustifolium TaxID=2727405 RepID=A0AAW2RNT2_9LAMI